MNHPPTSNLPSKVNLKAMEKALGHRFWAFNKILALFSLPINSIENCIQICTEAPPTSDIWKNAWAKWNELSQHEVDAAGDSATAINAMVNIPRHEDARRTELNQKAIQKAISFQTTFSGVQVVVEQASHMSVGGYEEYSSETLEIMRKLAKTIPELDWLCEKEYSGRDRSVHDFVPPSLKNLKSAFLKEIEGKPVDERISLFNLLSYTAKPRVVKVLVDNTVWTEKNLREILKKYWRGKNNILDVFLRPVLDSIMSEKVADIRDFETLQSIAPSVAGLQKATQHWEKNMSKALQEKLASTEGFDDLLGLYKFCPSASELNEAIWIKLLSAVTKVNQAETLFQTIQYDSSYGIEGRRKLVVNLWLNLAGDDLEEVDKIFGKTRSVEAYKRLLSGATKFSKALEIWNRSNRRSDDRELSNLGLRRSLELAASVCDGLEILNIVDDSRPAEAERVMVIKRMLELVKSEDDLHRIIRSDEQLDWESQAMIILKMAEFYPATEVEAATA